MVAQSSSNCRSKPALLAGLFTILIASSASADDTEAYTSQITAGAKPNLIFVLDYSDSMRARTDGGKTRLTVLKEAVNRVVDQNIGKVNIGIGSLFHGTATGIQWPVSDLEADASTIDPSIPPGVVTAADVIKSQIDRGTEHATSTVDALAETAAYLRGEEVYHNKEPKERSDYHQPATWDETLNRYTGGLGNAALPITYTPEDAYRPTGGTSGYGICADLTDRGRNPGNVNECAGKAIYDCRYQNKLGTIKPGDRCKYPREDLWLGATYKSPIKNECQVNAMILVSDGQPTTSRNFEAIENIIGHPMDQCEVPTVLNNDRRNAAARCGIEIAATLANNPQIAGIDDSVVQTHTIGFGTGAAGSSWLQQVADAGNGEFFPAESPEKLDAALDSIIAGLTVTSQSFSPLAIDVDRANFSHQNRAYFSMFEPTLNASWGGNLKGYFIGESGLVDINNNPATVLNASGTRVMADNAQSFWSLVSDGDKVVKGGASEQLASNNRILVTHTGPDDIIGTGVNLLADEHRLDSANSNITDADLGTTIGRDTLLDWIKTAPMGDPLHSQPVQVSYDNGGGEQQVIYVMTNQGFLHAIDATYPKIPDGSTAGGNEIFAFMPPELLPNIKQHYSNPQVHNRIYGLDGTLVRWHVDNNRDGIVNGSDTITLVFGMRRGGNHYYALDVTNPSAPRYKWRIDGGTTEFPRLGETWSRPSLVSVTHKGVEKQVLAFGGGYDAAMIDGSTAPVTGALGNAIYMVDENGDKVMEINGNNIAGMDYAIPSDLTIIDTDGDELVDRIYVGDLGGNLWRMDFDDIEDGATVEKLADLNEGGHRSFFYPPSVSLQGDFLAIAIGSGNRTNPLRLNSGDRMYMVRDLAVNTELPVGHRAVRTADLYNATDNDIGASNPTVSQLAKESLANANGWFINLDTNEKSLSPLVTYEGIVMATTYDIDLNRLADPCLPPGVNYFYSVELTTAEPVVVLTNSATANDQPASARKMVVNGDGILPQPILVFPDSGDVTVMVDNEVVSSLSQKFSRIFWYSK